MFTVKLVLFWGFHVQGTCLIIEHQGTVAFPSFFYVKSAFISHYHCTSITSLMLFFSLLVQLRGVNKIIALIHK